MLRFCFLSRFADLNYHRADFPACFWLIWHVNLFSVFGNVLNAPAGDQTDNLAVTGQPLRQTQVHWTGGPFKKTFNAVHRIARSALPGPPRSLFCSEPWDFPAVSLQLPNRAPLERHGARQANKNKNKKKHE